MLPRATEVSLSGLALSSLAGRRSHPLPPPRVRRALGAEGERVEVLGVPIAYEERGAGRPVVCLHALGHGASDYRAFAESLGPGFRVIALDWPDHGNSGPDAYPVSAGRYAELLAAFVGRLGLERPILLGNSIGGAAALELAARSPALPGALVLCNPGGLHLRSRFSSVVIGAFARFFEAGSRDPWWYRPAFAAYYRLVLSAEGAAAQRARIVAGAAEMGPLLAEGWQSFGRAGADLRGLAGEVRCPVLVAWATADRFNPLWANRAGLRGFRSHELVTFDVGHAPALEAPGAFAAAFASFARRAAVAG